MRAFSEKAPVCPKCQTVITQFDRNALRITLGGYYTCSNCHTRLNFRQVKGFMTETT